MTNHNLILKQMEDSESGGSVRWISLRLVADVQIFEASPNMPAFSKRVLARQNPESRQNV